MTHESNSGVGGLNLAAYATTTSITHKRDKRYKLNITHESISGVGTLNPATSLCPGWGP